MIARDGTPIGWEDDGAGGRCVLLVHGFPDARWWALVRPLLRDGLRIAAMDRRGRGRSGRGDDAGHTLDVEAGDVLSVARALGGHVVVAAHSIGATITLEALRRPGDLIAGAVLYEPPHPGGPSWEDQPPHMQAAITEGRHEDALMIFVREVVKITAEEVDLFRSSPAWQRAVDLVWTLRREGQALRALDPDLARYAQITVPVELLVGGRTARHLAETTDRLDRVLPNCHVTELPGQGHAALVTAPHLVAGAIKDFIGRLPERHNLGSASPAEPGTGLGSA